MSGRPRDGFLAAALAFELGLAGVAWLVGRPLGIDPLRDFDPTGRGLATGILATAPLVLLLVLCDRDSFRPMRRIREILGEVILPFLRGRPAFQLAALAAAAGIGEETLFRGLIQAGTADRLGPASGLILASVTFGLVHALTPAYALIAGLIGAYLGALYLLTGDLTVPVVAHGLYDLVALIYFLRTASGDTIGPIEPAPEETNP
ncbi:CPBP family intramembrane glutamic endopeptidase [Tautonia plasticadhaerens]|uniref:CAAX amino terminal protease self-immunity n=1 Tax=Tautonia plasticadhaerens TaxID=2527974 RepID=A0A518H7L8_9BACT|nr:CPBP family intramembrane glutamic endopeptidase [Tautonia plasticadhaerens]QDV36824.1 CAAX amino terminal protease self- immunity [Tautonia plasticadhaerens]